MKENSKRIQELTSKEVVLKFIHDYAYFETIIILSIYLVIGYFIDSNDICLLHSKISYLLILLSVITLFHGFENGVLALAIIAVAIWFAYPVFEYVQFLIALLMTMIFSEFHYYWTQKIKAAEITSNYRGAKLDELSKAFYTLKISHDQLEKNYVIKPMSIRNSIEHIINKHKEINEQFNDSNEKIEKYYSNFLELLETSFNVKSALIIYKKNGITDNYLDVDNSNIAFGTTPVKIDKEDIFSDYLVDKAIGRKTAIYISDEQGEPSNATDKNSHFIAAIPAKQENSLSAILVIEQMPFMAFNREGLTSISILLEYFSIEINKKILLERDDKITIVPDEIFRFEYARLHRLYENFDVNSIILVLRINNELQSARIYEKIIKMLRSLDMVALVKQNDYYYITLLFPLHDKASALGYLNRLILSIDEEKDKRFDHMTFNMEETNLLNKYYREDYGQ